jgi:hypothetical protein
VLWVRVPPWAPIRKNYIMSEAYTKEEVRDQFLHQVRGLAKYWSTVPGRTDLEKCEGLAFSIMNIFDGTSMVLPAMDITLRPHEDDKQFCIDNNEKYYEDGMVINDDCMLHERFFKE